MSRFNVATTLVVVEDKPTADTPVTGAISAAAAIGASTLTLTAGGAAFTSGKVFRLGSGATMETCVVSGAPTATSVPLASPLRKAHAIGEVMVEQVALRYGPTAAQIATSSTGRESSDVFVGESKFPATQRRGFESHKQTVNLLAPTPHNIGLALGLPRASVRGAGTAALPYQVGTNGSDLGTLANATVYLNGVLEDGTVFREERHGCSIDPTGLSIAIARGADQVVPVKLLSGSLHAQATNAAPVTGATTLVTTADEIIDSLTEGGYFKVKAAGLSTTLTAAAAAGTNILALALATAVAPGKWYRVGEGAAAQIVWAHVLAVLNVTLRTYLYADVAAGTSVTELELVPFLDLSDAGCRFTTGGSVREDRQGDQAQTTGYIVDSATLGVELGFKDCSLANFARAYGLADPLAATSQVISGMGLTSLIGIYAKGLSAAGKSVWMVAGNVYADVASVEYLFQSTGEKAPIPFNGKASSLLFLTHS